MTPGGQFVQFTQIAEMVREQWKKIGIDLVVQEVERSLALKRTAANEQQLGAWNNDGSEHLFTFRCTSSPSSSPPSPPPGRSTSSGFTRQVPRARSRSRRCAS